MGSITLTIFPNFKYFGYIYFWKAETLAAKKQFNEILILYPHSTSNSFFPNFLKFLLTEKLFVVFQKPNNFTFYGNFATNCS